jgi:two-component system sensor histidine kinase AlgZ
MTSFVSSVRGRWIFSILVTNLSVGLVLLILAVAGQFPTAHVFFRTLAYTLIFANLTGILGMAIMGAITERLARRQLPVVAVAIACITFVVPLGCLAAQALLILLGFAARQNFWAQYLHTLKVAMPLAIVFGLGALAYASLRGRLEVAELRLRQKELAEERTSKLAAEARLRSLESWIHPHFLFNTLNSISALIASDPARAEQIVGRLATLLRASLDSSNHSLIPLRQELSMVESYADIEKVRFGEKLRGSVQIPAELQETKVPPLSVQSLVENAVKHGITPQPNGGEFKVTARATDGAVHIEVRDSGPGFDFAAIPGGHGLDKLVQRLDALYGASASLSVSRHDGYSVVEMIVPRV